MLDNTPNQPYKYRTKNWVEVNCKTRGTYSANSEIKFKNSRIESSLCDYSVVYILASGTIIIIGAGAGEPTKQTKSRRKRSMNNI